MTGGSRNERYRTLALCLQGCMREPICVGVSFHTDGWCWIYNIPDKLWYETEPWEIEFVMVTRRTCPNGKQFM